MQSILYYILSGAYATHKLLNHTRGIGHGCCHPHWCFRQYPLGV